MSSATSRSDQHDHARLRLVTRFLPVSRILPRGPAAAHSPPAEFRRCTPPLTSAPSVGSSADAPGPLLRDPPLEPDAGGQADEGVEVVEAVAESDFLKARDGQVGLTVGDGVSQLFVYPARARSSGEFTQAVIHLTDVRRRQRAEGSRRGVRRVRHAGDADRERHCPDAGWRRRGVVQRLRGNLVGVVPA